MAIGPRARFVPAAASAHPLGNFSVNHLARVSVSADRVDVRYILDEAEIPTFQQRDVAGRDAARAQARRGRAAARADRRRPARRAAPGRPARRSRTRWDRAACARPASSCRCRRAVEDPRRVELRDGTFAGRVGWKAIVAAPGRGTAVRSNVPASDPTNGLRTYPADLLQSPSDVRAARLDAQPGAGTLTAPDGSRTVAGTDAERSDDGLTEGLRRRRRGRGGPAAPPARRVRLGRGARALARATARRWSPRTWSARAAGPRHAVALGAIVTVTHTAGVFALGADHARALAVRAARDALSVAEPGLRACSWS